VQIPRLHKDRGIPINAESEKADEKSAWERISRQTKVFLYTKNRIFPGKSGFSENTAPENLC